MNTYCFTGCLSYIYTPYFLNVVFLLGCNHNRILTNETRHMKQRTLLSYSLIFFFFFWEDVIVWSSPIEDNRGHWTSDVKIIPSASLGVTCTCVLFCKHQNLTWKYFLAKKVRNKCLRLYLLILFVKSRLDINFHSQFDVAIYK